MKAFLSKNQAKYIKSLQQKKNRIQEGRFVAEGLKNLAEALSYPDSIDFIVCQESESLKLDFGETPVFYADEKLWTTFSSQRTPSGVLAVCHLPRDAKAGADILALALDGVADPGNLGTIIRLCDWFGYPHIHLGLNSVDPFNPKVVQASMGSIFRIKFSEGDLIPWLAARKGPVYAADMQGSSIYDTDFSHPHTLVLGSESHGISPDVAALTEKVTIPRYGACESLNVASAAGIILSEIKRRAPPH